jgi:hypothetical protein
MTKEFKYTTEEHYLDFVLKCSEEDDAPSKLIGNQTIIHILADRKLPESWNQEKALMEVETLLHYFCDVEEYEMCQLIIDNWPELRTKNC